MSFVLFGMLLSDATTHPHFKQGLSRDEWLDYLTEEELNSYCQCVLDENREFPKLPKICDSPALRDVIENFNNKTSNEEFVRLIANSFRNKIFPESEHVLKVSRSKRQVGCEY